VFELIQDRVGFTIDGHFVTVKKIFFATFFLHCFKGYKALLYKFNALCQCL